MTNRAPEQGSKEKKVAVYNRGQRIYKTSVGDLKPQETLGLPEKEAKSLLGYSDLVDAAKMARQGDEAADPGLAKAHDALEKAHKALQEEHAAVLKVKADLEDQVLTLQGRVEELEKAAKK